MPDNKKSRFQNALSKQENANWEKLREQATRQAEKKAAQEEFDRRKNKPSEIKENTWDSDSKVDKKIQSSDLKELYDKEKKQKDRELFEKEINEFGKNLKQREEQKKEAEHKKPHTKSDPVEVLIQSEETFADKTLTIIGDKLRTELGWLSIIISTLMIPIHAWKWMKDYSSNRYDKATLAMKAIMMVGGMTLSALTIVAVLSVVYIATPVLVVVGAAKAVVENAWEFGRSLYERFGGVGKQEQKQISAQKADLKYALRENLTASRDQLSPANQAQLTELTRLTNTQRLRNKVVVDKAHTSVVAGVALVGAALLFTPAAPAGIIILATVTAYSIADAFGLNPFKLAARGINALSEKVRGKPLFDPFKAKKEDDVLNDLKNEIAHEKKLVPEKRVQTQTKQPIKTQSIKEDTAKILKGVSAHPIEAAKDLMTHDPLNAATGPLPLKRVSSLDGNKSNKEEPKDGESDGEKATFRRS